MQEIECCITWATTEIVYGYNGRALWSSIQQLTLGHTLWTCTVEGQEWKDFPLDRQNDWRNLHKLDNRSSYENGWIQEPTVNPRANCQPVRFNFLIKKYEFFFSFLPNWLLNLSILIPIEIWLDSQKSMTWLPKINSHVFFFFFFSIFFCIYVSLDHFRVTINKKEK